MAPPPTGPLMWPASASPVQSFQNRILCIICMEKVTFTTLKCCRSRRKCKKNRPAEPDGGGFFHSCGAKSPGWVWACKPEIEPEQGSTFDPVFPKQQHELRDLPFPQNRISVCWKDASLHFVCVWISGFCHTEFPISNGIIKQQLDPSILTPRWLDATSTGCFQSSTVSGSLWWATPFTAAAKFTYFRFNTMMLILKHLWITGAFNDPPPIPQHRYTGASLNQTGSNPTLFWLKLVPHLRIQTNKQTLTYVSSYAHLYHKVSSCAR